MLLPIYGLLALSILILFTPDELEEARETLKAAMEQLETSPSASYVLCKVNACVEVLSVTVIISRC